LLLAMWLGAGIADGLGDGALPTVLRYLSPSTHVTGFLRGTIAAGDIAYFASLAVVGLCAAVVIVEARR
jgi:hypothetical protein